MLDQRTVYDVKIGRLSWQEGQLNFEYHMVLTSRFSRYKATISHFGPGLSYTDKHSFTRFANFCSGSCFFLILKVHFVPYVE